METTNIQRSGDVLPVRLQESLGVAGAALSAILIVSFQLGLLRPFLPLLQDDQGVWHFIYYGFWSLTLVVVGTILLFNSDVRRRSMPVLVFCGACLALATFHPMDQVAKNYIVALGLIASVVVLALVSGPAMLLQLSASVTALSAVFCLLDVLFPDSLSSTAGRAAGLASNPNVAATGLLLGASASWWIVSREWRLSFLVLVAGAIVGTLSRSALLIAVLVVSLSVVAAIWRAGLAALPSMLRHGVARAVSVAFAVFVCLTVALWANDRFSVAVGSAFAGTENAVAAFRRATKSVQEAVAPLFPPQSDEQSMARLSNEERARIVAHTSEMLGIAAEAEGQVNSASARALLFQRSFLAYQAGPIWGRGLKEAHELAPHNSYLLFAVAFGHLGWLVPLGLIALTLRGAWRSGRFQLGAALAGSLLMSHDVVLFPAMLIPIALGIANAAGPPRRSIERAGDRSRTAVALVAVGAAIMLMVGLFAIHWRSGEAMRVRFDAASFRFNVNHSYIAQIPRPDFLGFVRVAGASSSAEHDSGRLVLSENGAALSDRTDDISSESMIGKGRYVILNRRALLFSSSDNSDPRSNGRSYTAVVPLEVHPLLFLLLGATAVWSMAVVRRWGRPTGSNG